MTSIYWNIKNTNLASELIEQVDIEVEQVVTLSIIIVKFLCSDSGETVRALIFLVLLSYESFLVQYNDNENKPV